MLISREFVSHLDSWKFQNHSWALSALFLLIQEDMLTPKYIIVGGGVWSGVYHEKCLKEKEAEIKERSTILEVSLRLNKKEERIAIHLSNLFEK